MFGKKPSKKDSSPDIGKKETKSSNIFDEFSSDDSLISEVEKLKDMQSKDLFYYFSIIGSILQNLFILMIFFIFAGKAYMSIQNNDQMFNKGFLDPICNFVIGSVPIPDNTTLCSSVAYTKDYYNTQLVDIKKEYSKEILLMIEEVYKNENFSKSKEVAFLLDKSESKLNVLEVLEKFDELKIDFLGIDKRRIQCENIVIDSIDNSLSMNCESFSKGYESNIIGFSGNKTDLSIGGTSISVANSFLNYIEKNSKDFELIDKQRIFYSTSLNGETSGYTMATPFDIKLKINF